MTLVIERKLTQEERKIARAAKKKIKRGWTQRYWAGIQLSDGSVLRTHFFDRSANCFCLWGAINAATWDQYPAEDKFDTPYAGLMEVLVPAIYSMGYLGIAGFNDDTDTTQQDVIDFLTALIEYGRED